MLGGALGLFALPLVVQLAGSLGPLPKSDLSTTFWRKGMRLMRDPETDAYASHEDGEDPGPTAAR